VSALGLEMRALSLSSLSLSLSRALPGEEGNAAHDLTILVKMLVPVAVIPIFVLVRCPATRVTGPGKFDLFLTLATVKLRLNIRVDEKNVQDRAAQVSEPCAEATTLGAHVARLRRGRVHGLRHFSPNFGRRREPLRRNTPERAETDFKRALRLSYIRTCSIQIN
jgi:hypothetical protein